MSQVVVPQFAVFAKQQNLTYGVSQKRGLPRPDLVAQRAHMDAQGITEDNIAAITDEAMAWARTELRKERR